MCAEIIDGFDDSPDYSKMVFQNSDLARIPTRSVFQKLDVVRILSRKNRFGIEFFLSRGKKKKNWIWELTRAKPAVPPCLLGCELCRRACTGRAAACSGCSSSALRFSPKSNLPQSRQGPGAESNQ